MNKYKVSYEVIITDDLIEYYRNEKRNKTKSLKKLLEKIALNIIETNNVIPNIKKLKN